MGGEAYSGYESKVKLPQGVSSPSDSAASSAGWLSGRKVIKHLYNGGRCYYGMNTVPLKSRTAENPNRWFLRCPHYKLSELRCEYFVWVDEVHDLDILREMPFQEKELSMHKCSWEDKAKLIDGSFKEDSNYVLMLNTISSMRCEIIGLRKLVVGMWVVLGILCMINLYNLRW
ncbi:hypothetical protein PIB30_066784 [Stylosanthes scabra]|uniref:GRF-type domain-containing protein n=1 Tax=Stylosanthes scabra TaxID=79078 RepID=A0ABU6UN03_9FABA|nr:hypothetical protein [Stylosanthes scabra]